MSEPIRNSSIESIESKVSTITTVASQNNNVSFGQGSLVNVPDNMCCSGFGCDALKKCIVHESTAVGFKAASNLTTAQSCSVVGCYALSCATEHLVADDNTVMGHRAAMNTNSSCNSAFGSSALLFNETGKENSAMGNQSSCLNVTGSRNTSMGHQSSYGTWEGDDNTTYGHCAQRSVSAVSRVSAFGSGALIDNNSCDMTAVGFNALHSNQTGRNGVAVGSEALCDSVGGSNCTAIGFEALKKSWGSDNTVVGALGMSKGNSTGGENTGVGSHVLYGCMGSKNTSVGDKSAMSLQMGILNSIVGQMAMNKAINACKNSILGANSGCNIINGEGNCCMGFQSGPQGDLCDTLCIGAGAVATRNGELSLGSVQHPLLTCKTVGVAGDAQVLPSAPHIYLEVTINGENYVMPLYKPCVVENK